MNRKSLHSNIQWKEKKKNEKSLPFTVPRHIILFIKINTMNGFQTSYNMIPDASVQIIAHNETRLDLVTGLVR